MFYRYAKSGARLAIDLDGLFEGEECFIAGGAPSLKDFAREFNVDTRGIHVLAMNNAATVLKPTLWVGGDKPICYDRSILLDPTFMKFALISRRDFLVEGKPWRDCANTFFYGTKESFNTKNFLNADRDLVWWQNTFFIALQLAYRLGFRKVYLVGCGFKITEKAQYAWETKLDEGEVKSNQKLYSKTAEQVRQLLPHFEERNFKVVSCTPDSTLNEFIQFEHSKTVLEGIREKLPKTNTRELPHSSKVSLVHI